MKIKSDLSISARYLTQRSMAHDFTEMHLFFSKKEQDLLLPLVLLILFG